MLLLLWQCELLKRERRHVAGLAYLQLDVSLCEGTDAVLPLSLFKVSFLSPAAFPSALSSPSPTAGLSAPFWISSLLLKALLSPRAPSWSCLPSLRALSGGFHCCLPAALKVFPRASHASVYCLSKLTVRPSVGPRCPSDRCCCCTLIFIWAVCLFWLHRALQPGVCPLF